MKINKRKSSPNAQYLGIYLFLAKKKIIAHCKTKMIFQNNRGLICTLKP